MTKEEREFKKEVCDKSCGHYNLICVYNVKCIDFPKWLIKKLHRFIKENQMLKDDNNYLNAIINGSWPNADRIIKKARIKNESI